MKSRTALRALASAGVASPFTIKGAYYTLSRLVGLKERKVLIRSPSMDGAKVERVTMLGNGRMLQFAQAATGLNVELPPNPPLKEAYVLKREGAIT